MTADLLREAAAVLRERAEGVCEEDRAIKAWTAVPRMDPDNDGWVVAHSPADADYDTTIAQCIYDYEGGTSRYIATMHPGVGLALADWLELAATAEELTGLFGDRVMPATSPQIRVARAILGRDA